MNIVSVIMPQRAIKILSRTYFSDDVDDKDDDDVNDQMKVERLPFPSIQLPFVMVGRDGC